MVEWKLRMYLGWKGKLRRQKEDGQGTVGLLINLVTSSRTVSEALKRMDQVTKKRAQGASWRSLRGRHLSLG